MPEGREGGWSVWYGIQVAVWSMVDGGGGCKQEPIAQRTVCHMKRGHVRGLICLGLFGEIEIQLGVTWIARVRPDFNVQRRSPRF